MKKNKTKQAKNKTKQASKSTFKGKRLKTQDDNIMYIEAEFVAELIKPNPSNRVDKDNRHHIRRLKRSMMSKGFSQHTPIVVGSDGQIKAGHHRYYAALELGIGVWIKIDDEYSLEEVTQIEGVSKKWNMMDWILKHANAEVGEFPSILAFSKKYNFGTQTLLKILFDSPNGIKENIYDDIREGKFEVKDWDKAHRTAKHVRSFAGYFEKKKDYSNSHFATAVIHCLGVKGYSPQEMERKASMQSQKIKLQRNRRDNLEMLQAVYNYKRSKRNKMLLVPLK